MIEKTNTNRWILGCIFIVLGILIIVIALVFPFHFFLQAWIHSTQTVTVNSYGRLQLEQNLFMGGIIKGQITSLNGLNTSIVIYIEDSSGRIIIGPKEIKREFKFEFQPQQTGLYNIVLDNMENNSQTFFVIIWQYYYNLLCMTLGFITFILGIASILTTTSNQQPTADQQKQTPKSEAAQQKA